MGLSISEIITIGSGIVKEAGKSPAIQKALFGTYTNGETRNLSDAINGEIYSPDERDKINKRIEKNEKKKKKRKKKGKKYAKIDLRKLAINDEDN